MRATLGALCSLHPGDEPGALFCPRHASYHESLLRNESTANAMLATTMRTIIPMIMETISNRGQLRRQSL
jgi:hypothetical protein